MASTPTAVCQIRIPGQEAVHSGKVRDLFEIGDDLILVSSDRVSAYDVVMDQGMPGRGIILTQLSKFWFDLTRDLVDNHLISTDVDSWPEIPEEARPSLRGRSMRCRKAERLPVEWVVRGYLTGSGWKDYQAIGSVSGVELPPGLQHASRFDPPILTASTKADEGHDEPISFDEVVSLVGEKIAAEARDLSIALYLRGHEYAASKGFVIADTKFEFGLVDSRLTLIDECLTPDSSRFWPKSQVEPGAHPESFDKQVLRDYLSSLDWNKQPPAPSLPSEILERAMGRYVEIYTALTGQEPFDAN